MLQMLKYTLCALMLLISIAQCNAQAKKKPLKPQVNKKPITRKVGKEIIRLKEVNFGVGMHSDGWGIDVQRLKRNEESDDLDYSGFYCNMAQVYHPREFKTTSKLQSPSKDNAPPNQKYVFGKINTFIPVNIGYIKRKNISNKLEHYHVQLHVLYGGGLSLGLAKPYYLQIARNVGGVFLPIEEKYSEANANQFLNPQFIYGSSGFFKGWGELELYPGIQARSAVQFDYSLSPTSNLIIEVGAQLSAYINTVPILAGADNKAIFPNIYASIKKSVRW
jgi:hypothetical protein